jgi:hypothetical protein
VIFWAIAVIGALLTWLLAWISLRSERPAPGTA